MKNAQYHTHDVKERCENKLGISFRAGKEFNGWFVLDGIKVKRIIIPKGRKPIPPKTYKVMAKQLNLEINEFDDFLDCLTNYQKFISIIKEKI